MLTFHFHIFIYSTCNHFTYSGSSNGCQEKLLKQNAVRSKYAKLKCREFTTLQKWENKMQRKIKCFTVLLNNISEQKPNITQ